MKVNPMADAAGFKQVREESLQRAINLAHHLMTVQADVIVRQDELKICKEQQRKIEEEQLPNLMDELGLAEFKLQDGITRIDIKSFLKASLPSQTVILKTTDPEVRARLMERRTEGLEWLRDGQGKSLIKDVVTIDIPSARSAKSAQRNAMERKVNAVLKVAEKMGLLADRSETVHTQSLTSYLKEMLEQGVDIPMDTFAVFEGRKARVSIPKKKQK